MTKRLIVNCETGEQTIVDYTLEELAEVAKAKIEEEKEQKEKEKKNKLKQSAIKKLNALGLTIEEINTIL